MFNWLLFTLIGYMSLYSFSVGSALRQLIPNCNQLKSSWPSHIDNVSNWRRN